ncbi:unannotated protein [freshwater metagenome]|uniref:Unannotated protein n=1 Tax=freshwater metagenome TaxID=449393 RepID=A0A6J7EDN5_9ZZZZ|nr:ATP-binding cassette domain-containing protein [Actinomycetota bacterium]
MSTVSVNTSLSVRGVTSGYGQVTVLRDASIDVSEGEIVAILGANGAGKSTLLKTIVGLLKPSTGSVEAYGEDVTGAAPDRITRKGIVLVPEGRQLFDSMTVRENLQLGAYTRPRSEQAESMERVFELFPIVKDRLSQRASTMSGGQRQMVAIGRALMARPSLLLLDEPSLGLAPIVIQETFEALKRLREDGMTILIVEQNANMTLKFADRAYVLDRGRVTMDGPASELAADPRIREAYLGIHTEQKAPLDAGAPAPSSDES